MLYGSPPQLQSSSSQMESSEASTRVAGSLTPASSRDLLCILPVTFLNKGWDSNQFLVVVDGTSLPDQFHLSKHELVRLVVDEAVSVRVRQLFVDGNHRTAILSVYEKLADAGWWLDMSAIDLYILISNRNQAEWSMIKVRMVKNILGHLKHEPDIPVHARQIYAGRVKLIAEINTLFEDVEAFLTSPGPDMCEKRMKWRCFRRCSKKRHIQYVSLYGRPHIK